MTIKDAATRLGVSRQRVSQMLGSGELEGPVPAGVRASPNAPRVSIVSLQAAEKRRAEGRSTERTRSGREATLRDDAHRLKLALDVARDQIARQRSQNERLAKLLAETVTALQEEQALARDADRITEEYAAIATNHLAPDAGPEQS